MSKQQSQLLIEWGGGVLDFILRSEKQQWKGNGEDFGKYVKQTTDVGWAQEGRWLSEKLPGELLRPKLGRNGIVILCLEKILGHP